MASSQGTLQSETPEQRKKRLNNEHKLLTGRTS